MGGWQDGIKAGLRIAYSKQQTKEQRKKRNNLASKIMKQKSIINTINDKNVRTENRSKNSLVPKRYKYRKLNKKQLRPVTH